LSANRQNQYYQNKILIRDYKEFYNQCENAPIKEEIENFWKEKYGEKIQCNEEVYWIKTLQTKFKYGMEPCIWKKVTTALRTKLNWRVPLRY